MYEAIDKFTKIDLELASVYYTILVDRCKDGDKSDISYGELVDIAKEKRPENASVANAIPLSTGRRLGVIRYFVSKKGLPDLTCLVVRQNTRTNGEPYLREFDSQIEHVRVFEKDWTTVTSDFNYFIEEAIKIVTRRNKRSRKEAEQLNYSFYKENKHLLTPNIADYKEEIVEMLMDEFAVEDAFADFFTKNTKILT
jgi:hypothetical protein